MVLGGFRSFHVLVTTALLYQLSYEATHCERGQFIEFISREDITTAVQK